MTASAPLELIMVEFSGNHFRGDIVPALTDLVGQFGEAWTMRLDL